MEKSSKTFDVCDIEDMELECAGLASLCRIVSEAMMYSPNYIKKDYAKGINMLADLMSAHAEKMNMLVKQEFENQKESIA